MRGDSLRDLYAKTLAVLGLGLLAGAGAIVDYWPVGSPVPAIGSPTLPAPRVPALSQRLDQKIPAPSVRSERAVLVRGTIHAKNVGSARFLTPGLGTVPADSAAETTPARVPDLTVATIEIQWDVLLATPAQEFALLAVMPPPVVAPAPGFIGGALRKTKDSLGRAGAVTGATIADAVAVTGATIAKGVVGAFKKVTPF